LLSGTFKVLFPFDPIELKNFFHFRVIRLKNFGKAGLILFTDVISYLQKTAFFIDFNELFTSKHSHRIYSEVLFCIS